jgi:hypothetical protein
MPVARLRPNLPLQLERHALYRDLALLVVDLDEALSDFVRRVGVLLEVDIDGGISLVDAAASCDVLFAFHHLTC